MSRIAIALSLCALVALPAYAAPSQNVQAAPSQDVQTRIFRYFLTKARAGDPNAEFIVGNLYENGKGVPQDKQKARKWYEKAAAQGNQSARNRLDRKKLAVEKAAKAKQLAAARAMKEREQAAHARIQAQAYARARAREEAAQRAERAANTRAAEAARQHALAARAAAQRQAAVQARAPIDALPVVLGGSWYYGTAAIPYLPSPEATCIQAGSGEIVCFSERLHREVGGSTLTYTIKSKLSGFNHQGDFTVSYLFDVVDIGSGSGVTAADPVYDPDPAVQSGWQQPAQTLQCRAQNAQVLACSNRQNQRFELARH